MRVLHEKTGEENWVPLFDDAGVPLYPELMAELDALKRDRIGGLCCGVTGASSGLGRPTRVTSAR